MKWRNLLPVARSQLAEIIDGYMMDGFESLAKM
jgi:hypothetical protein